MNRISLVVPIACLTVFALAGPVRADDPTGPGSQPADPAVTDARPCDPTDLRFGGDCLESADALPGFFGSAERPYWRRNLFKRFALDQRFLLTTWWPAESRSFRFSVPVVVGVAGASASADSPAGIDLRWQRSFENWAVGGRRDIAEGFTRLGSVESGVVLLGSSYLISRWAGKERMQRTSSLSAEALMNTALYTGLLKRMTRRTRPASAGTGQFFVDSPQAGQSPTSFPSGHATGAFAVATVFATEYRDKRWVGYVAYGTASLVALSRVALGRHFPSDVLVGAVLGNSIGRMVSHRNGGTGEIRPWARVEPLFDPDNNGVGVAYRHTW